MQHSLALYRDLGIRSGVPLCLEALAGIVVNRDARSAARLLGAAEAGLSVAS